MTKSNKIPQTNNFNNYCNLHRTIKRTNQFYKNNKKKKISLCDGKIIYNKNLDK